MSVGQSVCQQRALWQNGSVNPDAVWNGKRSRSRDECIRWVVIVEGEMAVLGLNLGRPIVTNGDFATRLFSNYFGQDLLDFSPHRCTVEACLTGRVLSSFCRSVC